MDTQKIKKEYSNPLTWSKILVNVMSFYLSVAILSSLQPLHIQSLAIGHNSQVYPLRNSD
jgi:hypothetical protein